MNNVTRKFIAIIGLDEEKMITYSGNNDVSPGDFLEQEFGWSKAVLHWKIGH